MNISLSDSQVSDILNQNNIPHKIMTYTEVADCENISEVLHPHGTTVICYLTRENYGHWTCLWRQDDQIHFFDPYGLKPDFELDWSIDPEFRQQAKEDYSYLTNLLLKASIIDKEEVEYNPYDFQAHKKGVATCGRHTTVRLCLKFLSDNQYKDIIKKCCKKVQLDPDELVVLLTTPLP